MQAWAVLLGSSKYNAIFCVLANTEQEALGEAFTQLSNNLTKKSNGEEVKDYRAIIWVPCTIPGNPIPKGVETNSSFEEQISRIVPR